MDKKILVKVASITALQLQQRMFGHWEQILRFDATSYGVGISVDNREASIIKAVALWMVCADFARLQ